MNERSAEDRLRYAKQFQDVLLNGDASRLLQLSADKRVHAMKAFSNLAKFAGCYDRCLQLRERYNLKWSTGNKKIDAFQRLFDDNKTFDKMLVDLKETIKALPKDYADFVIFATLTCLRISECIDCIRLMTLVHSRSTTIPIIVHWNI